MTMTRTNFPYSTILTAPSPATSGTSFVLQSGDGANFSTKFPIYLTVWPAGVNPLKSNAEIVQCTAISTDTPTIVRAQQGTSARTILVGDQVAQTVDNGMLLEHDGDSDQQILPMEIFL